MVLGWPAASIATVFSRCLPGLSRFTLIRRVNDALVVLRMRRPSRKTVTRLIAAPVAMFTLTFRDRETQARRTPATAIVGWSATQRTPLVPLGQPYWATAALRPSAEPPLALANTIVAVPPVMSSARATVTSLR